MTCSAMPRAASTPGNRDPPLIRAERGQLRPAVVRQPEYREDRRGDEQKPRDKTRHRIARRKGLLSSCPLTRPERAGHRADPGARNVVSLPDRCLPGSAGEMSDVTPPRGRRAACLDGTEDRETYRGAHLAGRVEYPRRGARQAWRDVPHGHIGDPGNPHP